MLKYTEEFDIPDDIRQIAHEAVPQTTGVLKNAGAQAFAGAFDYEVHDLEDLEILPIDLPARETVNVFVMLPDFLQVTTFETAYERVEAHTGLTPSSEDIRSELEKLRAETPTSERSNDTTGEAS